MIYPSNINEEPEKYSDYKNRTMDKLSLRATQLSWAIEECSLKKDDKIKLRKKIQEIFNP